MLSFRMLHPSTASLPTRGSERLSVMMHIAMSVGEPEAREILSEGFLMRWDHRILPGRMQGSSIDANDR
jgi:hypothetical protein